MNHIRTAVPPAGMAALFAGAGNLLGGEGGMVITFQVALAMNVFAYWNSHRMVLHI